jgi:hypothetical protein
VKFTKNSIVNKSLQLYLLHSIAPISHKQEKGCLVNVYESEIAIEALEAKIKKYKRDARYNRWVPLWKNHISILKALK